MASRGHAGQGRLGPIQGRVDPGDRDGVIGQEAERARVAFLAHLPDP